MNKMNQHWKISTPPIIAKKKGIIVKRIKYVKSKKVKGFEKTKESKESKDSDFKVFLDYIKSRIEYHNIHQTYTFDRDSHLFVCSCHVCNKKIYKNNYICSSMECIEKFLKDIMHDKTYNYLDEKFANYEDEYENYYDKDEDEYEDEDNNDFHGCTSCGKDVGFNFMGACNDCGSCPCGMCIDMCRCNRDEY